MNRAHKLKEGSPNLLRQVLTKNLIAVSAEEEIQPSSPQGTQCFLHQKTEYTESSKIVRHTGTPSACPMHCKLEAPETSVFGEVENEPESPDPSAALTTAFPFHVNVSPPTPENVQHQQQSSTTSTDIKCELSKTETICQNFSGLSLISQAHGNQSSSLLPVTSSQLDQHGAIPSCGKRHSSTDLSSCSPTVPMKVVRRCDITFGDIIGKGAFGKVYAGTLRGRPVAVKVVQKRRGSGIHREILQAERLAFNLNLRHENIVNIYGVNLCDGLRGDALIIMELVSPITLQSVLDDHSRIISQMERLTFAVQMSRALHYLHSNDVVHLDIKPRNVLMTLNNMCKLADFGSLTRTRTDVPREETDFTQLLGTLPYRAPELMKGCYPTNKADIFSFGITLWQLATRETPHVGANPHWLIYQVTKGNRRPDLHDTGSDDTEIKYGDIYKACWDADPERRPNAGETTIVLQGLIEECDWNDGWMNEGRCKD